ncbi:perlucin-like [Ylistrum balloti]|uniref:perlucin-like n=1 Tax=Ylistrum balloti TaxID=509963 RepID=UPI002905E9D1|nr:perlucin-like [Ylistrum balloti]
MAGLRLLRPLTLWTVLLSPCLSVCPDGSIVHQTSCYLFFNMRATWSEAEFYCRLLKTDLLSIDTAEEQTFIGNHLAREGSATFSKDGMFWTGGTTIMTGGRWMWEGESIPVGYEAWASGEPDTQSAQKRCLAMVFNNNFQWRASVCDRKHHFVCEASAFANSNSGSGGVIIG